MDYSHLLYKRGYLFSEEEVEPPVSSWTTTTIGEYFIAFDPENPWAFLERGNNWAAFLGKVLDTVHWTMDIEAIANECLGQLCRSEECMLDYIDHLAGRFVVIYHNAEQTKFMGDAFGTRSTFYTFLEPVMIASHCRIIEDHLHLGRCKHLEIIKSDPKWINPHWIAYPGILTPYENVYILTPNTLINVEQRRIERFYPRKALSGRDIADVIPAVSTTLRRETELLASKYDLAISLSAGIDTRTTLAAARNIAKNALFFTYGHIPDYRGIVPKEPGIAEYIAGKIRFAEKMRDIDLSIAHDIANALRLQHIYLDDVTKMSQEDMEDLDKILDKNTYSIHLRGLARAYLELLSNVSLHIRSNVSEIGSALFRRRGYESPLTGEKMAQVRVQMGHNRSVIGAFCQFAEVTRFNDILNYDPYDMFLWEHEYGTWLPNVLLESDIAFDTFETLNSRALVEEVLSVPLEQRLKSEIHYGIISHLWPVLLEWPINERPFKIQLEELRAKNDKLDANHNELQEKLKGLREETEGLKRHVGAVRNSLSYRLGDLLVQAVYKPGSNTILLPYRLVSLCVTELSKRKTRSDRGIKYSVIKLADVKLSTYTAMIKEKYIERFGVDKGRLGWYTENDWRRINYISSLLPEGKSILDIGMGSGAFLNLLLSLNRFQRILGIDIRRYSKLTMLFERQLYQIMYASVTNLPFTDKSVDIVTCMEVMEHIDKQSFLAALSELRRVSRFLVVTVPYNEREPLPSYHKLKFTDNDLLTYFPHGEFILFKKSAGTDWMVIVERP